MLFNTLAFAEDLSCTDPRVILSSQKVPCVPSNEGQIDFDVPELQIDFFACCNIML